MGIQAQLYVEEAMKELLTLHEQNKHTNPSQQLNILIERIKEIKDTAEKGYYP